jgi:hypothetical protein
VAWAHQAAVAWAHQAAVAWAHQAAVAAHLAVVEEDSWAG